MNRVVCLVALAFAFSVVSPAQHASASRITKRVESASAPDLIVTCDPGPITVDYKAQTASGVALNDPYAAART